jgi:thiol-disulfide isomerase/thioredoxin
MLKSSLIILAVILSLTVYGQTDSIRTEALTWHTDVMKVHDLSKATNKPVFAFFTGSDWCGWCRLMQQKIFARPEFIQWANNNVILLELDFPNKKQLSQELMQQNHGLKQFFDVKGFPTIWMFYLSKDAVNNKMNVSPIGSLGYPQRPEAGKEHVSFLEEANKLLANYSKK